MKTTNLFRRLRILALGCAFGCTATTATLAQELQPVQSANSAIQTEYGSLQPLQPHENNDPPIVTVAQMAGQSDTSDVPIIKPGDPNLNGKLFKAMPLNESVAPAAGSNGQVRTAEMTIDQNESQYPTVISTSHQQQGSFAPPSYQRRYPGQVNLNAQQTNQIFPGNTQARSPLTPQVPAMPTTSNLFGNQEDQSVPVISQDQAGQPTFQLPLPPANNSQGSVDSQTFQDNNFYPQNNSPTQDNYLGQPGGYDQGYDQGYGQHNGSYNSFQNNGYGEPDCADNGYGNESIEEYFKCCGFVCDACSYFIGEALYWEREDGRVIGTNMFRTAHFDRELGGRFTYGRRWDEMSGWELGVMGFESFVAVSEQRDPQGRLLGNLFGTVDGFNSDAFFSSFRGDQFIDQRQKSNLFSIESNKVWFGWDVAKFFYGVRYINFDDDFRMTSRNINNQFGFYDMEIDNHMWGAHVGGEIFHDVGYRLSFSFKAKAGAYINLIEGDTVFFNNGNPVFANGDNDTDIAYSVEAGIMAHYQLLPRLRMTAGYEFLSLLDVATTAQNFNPIQRPTTGSFYRTDDDAFFHGMSVGIEMYR